MSLTGLWKLNLKKSSSQTELLKAMGRPTWQIWVIDKANEDFQLHHFIKNNIHFFEKHVVIYLDSIILKALSTMFNVDKDKVKYRHMLLANKQPVKHKDDEKQFGDCESISSYENSVFTIRWYLRRGLLKVDHFINPRHELEVHMSMTTLKQTVEAVKIYDRYDIDETKINQTYLEYLQK